MSTTISRGRSSVLPKIPPNEAKDIAYQEVWDLIERTKEQGSLPTYMVICLQDIAEGKDARATAEEQKIAKALLLKYQNHPKRMFRSVAVKSFINSHVDGNGATMNTPQIERGIRFDPFTGERLSPH
jgi:hypothetical protein